ncbi:hypothetical protein [Morganella sp. EGD-HP17]|uniref:hypothetical protein n=1 Tax=Morganella sp. EGD-HP17 TaxID=1435146 RepID=UPI000446951A|nr:hypothetical protein [Morganella sp. EGD-HP17]ETO41241.1 hypothetical protein X965_11225 [Morganella sp. EGD-HP17]
MTKKRKTYNITEDRQIKLERLAINLSQKIEKQVRWSELLTYIIDKYSKIATEDLIYEYEEKQKK